MLLLNADSAAASIAQYVIDIIIDCAATVADVFLIFGAINVGKCKILCVKYFI